MLRFSGGSEEPGDETTRPSIAMVPSLGARKPAIMRRVVVLPQPDGPSSETNSPGGGIRLRRSTAVTAPKRRLTSVSTRRITWRSFARGRRGRSGGSPAAPTPPWTAPRGGSRAGPSQEEVAADQAEAQQHHRDRDRHQDEAHRGEQLEVALVALVEEEDGEHLGSGRVGEDGGGQLAGGRNEHQDERARESALQQWGHHPPQREEPAAAQDP